MADGLMAYIYSVFDDEHFVSSETFITMLSWNVCMKLHKRK